MKAPKMSNNSNKTQTNTTFNKETSVKATTTNKGQKVDSIQDIIRNATKAVVKVKVVYVYDHFNKYNVISIDEFTTYLNSNGDMFGVIIENKERLMKQTVKVTKNYQESTVIGSGTNGVCMEMVSPVVGERNVQSSTTLKATVSEPIFQKTTVENIGNPLGYCHNYSCVSRDKARYTRDLNLKRIAINNKLQELEHELVEQQKFLKAEYGAEFNYTRPVVVTNVPVKMGETLIHTDGITVECSKSAWGPVTKRNGQSNFRTISALTDKFGDDVIEYYTADVKHFNELKSEIWDLRMERKEIKIKISDAKDIAVDSTDNMSAELAAQLIRTGYNVNPVNSKGTALKAKAQLVHVEYKYDEAGNRSTCCPYCAQEMFLDSVRRFVAVDASKNSVISELKNQDYIINGVKVTLDFNGTDLSDAKVKATVAKADKDYNKASYVRKSRNFKVKASYTGNIAGNYDEVTGYTSTAEGNDYKEASISEQDMQDFWSQGGMDIDAERLEEYTKVMNLDKAERVWDTVRKMHEEDTVRCGVILSTKDARGNVKLGGKASLFFDYEAEVRDMAGVKLDYSEMEPQLNFQAGMTQAMDYDMGESFEYENSFGGKSQYEDSFYTDMSHYYGNMESCEDLHVTRGDEMTIGVYNDSELAGSVQVRPDFKARYDRICAIMNK